MAKPKLDLDGPWQAQLETWVRDHSGPLPSVEAFDRAYGIAMTLAGMPDMPVHCEQVTVRNVITMTEEELLTLKGIRHRTMKLVKAFLKSYEIYELGPANAKPSEEASPAIPPYGVDHLMATGHA